MPLTQGLIMMNLLAPINKKVKCYKCGGLCHAIIRCGSSNEHKQEALMTIDSLGYREKREILSNILSNKKLKIENNKNHLMKNSPEEKKDDVHYGEQRNSRWQDLEDFQKQPNFNQYQRSSSNP
jgi:hypothetical protein